MYPMFWTQVGRKSGGSFGSPLFVCYLLTPLDLNVPLKDLALTELDVLWRVRKWWGRWWWFRWSHWFVRHYSFLSTDRWPSAR